MARETGSVCKLCRREGEKLYLKGARCESAKCAIVKRNYQPGQHSWSRGRPSNFGVRLREKQKLKRYFGVSETSFRLVFERAARLPGNTGEHLIKLLLQRLDHVVQLAGISLSRRHARQLIQHGHVFVNGRRCNIPSANVRQGDTLSFSKREKVVKHLKEAQESRKGESVPSWLQLDEAAMTVRVAELPKREHLEFPVDEQLVVELMSR
ncbi:MAG: 30S ribosomal protein S4 [Planctomycetes bacterium]|nr:30S ribosomal protein S4 [Planctomycetota bacterium]